MMEKMAPQCLAKENRKEKERRERQRDRKGPGQEMLFRNTSPKYFLRSIVSKRHYILIFHNEVPPDLITSQLLLSAGDHTFNI
jgi:hypothetical protein